MRWFLLSFVPLAGAYFIHDVDRTLAGVAVVAWGVMLVGGCVGAALGGFKKGL